MTDTLIRPAAEAATTRTHSGDPATYPNTRDGRRQAILDGLSAIEPTTVGADIYLPTDDCLQLVASVLYPAGIETEEAYQRVCLVVEKACAHLGYGPEVTLGPPTVPFSRRGTYRKRYPPVEAAEIHEALELAGTSSTAPRREIRCPSIWATAGRVVYGRAWHQLSEGEQTPIRHQVEAVITAAGWHKDDTLDPPAYVKPLPIDEAGARARLTHLLQREDGRPLTVSNVIFHLQQGAYGRGFYTNDLDPVLKEIAAETLEAHGYLATPEDGNYRPRPVTLIHSAAADLAAALAALTPVLTDDGPALRLPDVLAVVGGPEVAISEWQAAELLARGPLSDALARLGYRMALSWVRPHAFDPPLESRDAQPVLFKAVRVQHDSGRKLTLAQGLAVLTPILVIDDEEDTLIALQMLGPKQSVRANWAALVGGGKIHWLGRQRIRLDGMKAHIKLTATLPCGWADHVLLHKQTSLKAMNPEEPFYLLDDGTQPVPPLFYPMLNKCLSLPILESWTDYLWAAGRAENLITLLDDGRGQGYAAWRVLPAPEAWEAIVQSGLEANTITF